MGTKDFDDTGKSWAAPAIIELFPQHTKAPLMQNVYDFMSVRNLKTAYFRFRFNNSTPETDYLDVLVEDSSLKNLSSVIDRVFNVYENWLLKVDPTPERLEMFDRPLKDSGQRRDFSTGSRRDVASGKGRYDLLPFEVIDALAKHYEKGYQKYDPDHVWSDVDNWQKGQPLSVFLDSGLRHSFKWKAGMKDEDHLIAAIWNLIAAWWTQDQIRKGELPIELGDTGELWRENRDLTKGKK